jgi:hypothetical protein
MDYLWENFRDWCVWIDTTAGSNLMLIMGISTVVWLVLSVISRIDKWKDYR